MNYKVLTLASLAALSTVGAVGFTVYQEANNVYPKLLLATNTYSCASIHFGMNDSTSEGYVATYGTTYTEAKSPYESLGYVSGVDVESFSVTGANAQWLDEGTTYTISKVKYTSDKVHGLKLGTGSNNTTLTYTFTQNVVGCDVYAVGWNDTGITLSVNGEDAVDIPKNSAVSGNFDDKFITYTKYHFDFTASNTLEIATTKRLFIGDIALRVQA